MERNFRKQTAVLSQESSQKELGGRADIAESEFALFTCGRPPDARQRFIPALQEQTAFAKQGGPRRGQPHIMPGALQDRSVELSLDLLNRPGQCRLSHTEAAGRPRIAQFLRNRLEVAQVTQVHSNR